ncbi:MAG: hypothetical protein IKJ68_08085, partial [Clostridia bacterium]|nr:hypothetical protein [Clostridia bacterium]
MSKNFIAILITVIMSFTMPFGAGAQGLPDKPDITDFSYTLKDKTGASDATITSGGILEVNITLDNNTASIQPYTVLLQILNKGTKVSLKAVSGTLSPSQEETLCLSDGFSENETDFSNYSAEVYVWSDMDSMQPISTYSVLGSDNHDIYAYKIDNTDLLYAHNNTNLSYSFGKGYAGRLPVITPIFHDMASRYVLSDTVQPVTSDSQQTLGFLVSSQRGTTKNYNLTMYGEDNSNNTKNADLTGITLPMGAYNGNYNEIGVLYPIFNKDVTEYNVYTYTSGSTSYRPVAGLEIGIETVNSDATVALTAAPDTTLNDTYAIYTVTSADGNVTKDYKINYHAIEKDTNSLAITGYKNGLDNSTGSYIMWGYRLSDTQIANN